MNLDTAIDRAVEAVGLTVLKPLQRDIILSFCSGNDVFVSLPTGYGKSYCFVLLPITFLALMALSLYVYPHSPL